MPVRELPQVQLIGEKGSRHFASEPHLRIQVIPISKREQKRDLFQFHGELLLICLEGQVVVQTIDNRYSLDEHDQLLLIDGEGFWVEGCTEFEAKVQFIWAPGANLCAQSTNQK